MSASTRGRAIFSGALLADNLTKTHDDSNRELIGQGIGNMAAALILQLRSGSAYDNGYRELRHCVASASQSIGTAILASSASGR